MEQVSSLVLFESTGSPVVIYCEVIHLGLVGVSRLVLNSAKNCGLI